MVWTVPGRSRATSVLIIRADAGVRIGTGHVMRCLALAQAWQNSGGHAVFAMATEAPVLQARIESEGMGAIRLPVEPGSADDAACTCDLAVKLGAHWVVVDGYQFDARYHRAIKETGLRLLVIDDDGHAGHYCADVVVNQNLHSTPRFYADRESYTQLLLGVRYVLLRREFLRWRKTQRSIPRIAGKVLVTLGGSDLHNNASKVIRSLQGLKASCLSTVVVAGAINPHVDGLEKEIAESGLRAVLVRGAWDMAELMAWADIAVSTAGTTVWELAFMGVPTVVGVSAPIEEALAAGLEKHRLFVNLGFFDRIAADELANCLRKLMDNQVARSRMSRLGRSLVTGAGCSRVLRHLSGNQ